MQIQKLLDNQIELPSSVRRAWLGFLLMIYLCLAIPSILTNSTTIDEFTHIPVGYAQAQYGLFQLESANPPLIRMIFGYPIGFYSPIMYWGDQISTIHYHPYCNYFMENNMVLYHLMVMTSRFVVLAISLFLAYLVYRWAREEYGVMAGLFALVLCLFNPNMLAHGTLATLDTGLTFLWIVTLYSVKKYMDKPSWTRTILLGILLGLVECSKFTSLLLFMLIPFIFLMDSGFRVTLMKKRTLLQGLIILLLCFLVINAVYGFQNSFTPLGQFEFKSSFCKSMVSLLPPTTPVPVPYYFLSGFDLQLSNAQSFSNYLNGQFSDSGFWYYYLEGFFIKNPIPFLIFLIWAFILIFKKKQILSRSEQIWILSAFFVILFFSLSKTKNIGLRYILPAFPFLFLLCGKIITPALSRRQIIFSGFLVFWYLGSAFYICPQFLPYYNELIGGPLNGHKYMIDSNTDWGQDSIRLKVWMNRHNLHEIYYNPDGPVDPLVYGINFQRIPTTPVTGYIAISVNDYYGVSAPAPSLRDRYQWLEKYTPIAHVGYSIFVYYIPPQV